MQHPKAWQKMNRHLANHFASQVKATCPQNRQELLMMMQAVKHTCEAGDMNLALKTYSQRVRSHTATDAVHALQAFDIDLYILVNFFKGNWQRFQPSIPRHMRTYLLNWAYKDLLELGHKREALSVLGALKQHLVTYKNWTQAGVVARRACRLHLDLGEINKAVAAGKEYIVYADLSGNPAEHIRSLLGVVKILHDHNYGDEAFTLFQQAEQVFNNPKLANDHELMQEMYKLRRMVKVVRGERAMQH